MTSLKSQWSVAKHSEKEITALLVSLPCLSHEEAEYSELLEIKQRIEKGSKEVAPQLLLAIVDAKPKQSLSSPNETLCVCCLQELTHLKHWCKICGSRTCKKCIVRTKECRSGQLVDYCQKCDREYLQALQNLLDYNQKHRLQLGFMRLVREQEILEGLIAAEKQRLINYGKGDARELVTRANAIVKLREQNKHMEGHMKELEKKIAFGRLIKRDLSKRLHQLRREQKESFGSLVRTDDLGNQIQPPQAENELDISMENFKESMLTTMLENEKDLHLDIPHQHKCKCAIY